MSVFYAICIYLILSAIHKVEDVCALWWKLKGSVVRFLLHWLLTILGRDGCKHCFLCFLDSGPFFFFFLIFSWKLILASFFHENKDTFQYLLSSALSIPMLEGWVKQEADSLSSLEKHTWYPWLGWARWPSANHLCTGNGRNFMLLGCWGDLPRPPWEMSSASLRRNIKSSTSSKMPVVPCLLFLDQSPPFLLSSKPLLGTLPIWQLGSGCTDLLVILQGIVPSVWIHLVFFPPMWINGLPSTPPLFYLVFSAAPVLTALVMQPL